jgi:N-sulfoglucosamine sulfohydrolase
MAASRPASPSVLLIIADDWSPIAGCYGNRVIQTPHIDALARRGVVFDRAFCTTPSCAASRANLLTGLYSHTHGQYGHCHGGHGFRTHEHVTSLPTVLRKADIRSGLIGKQHVAPLSVYPFDTLAQGKTQSVNHLVEGVDGFLNDAGDRPFYLHVAPTYPHRVGYAFGAEHHRDEFPAFHYAPGDVTVPDWLPDLPEVRQDLAHYYEAVSRYDHCVGQVLAALDRSGRADDTLVLVMTDHGMPFPGAKASSFEAGHHCPLIVAPPKGALPRHGPRCNALVNWTDIMPTVLDWLTVPREHWPKALAGRSFLPVLGEAEPNGWDETYYAHCFHEVTNYFPYRVLRGRRYKFVQHLAAELPMPLPADLFRSPTWTAVREQDVTQLGGRTRDLTLHRPAEALYDLQTDPLETRNVLDEPELRSVADAMRDKLIDFRMRTADPWLEVDYQRGRVTQEQRNRSRVRA